MISKRFVANIFKQAWTHFICTQLYGFTYLYQIWIILFTINHLFAHKYFQVLLFNTNNPIKHKSFVYTLLND